MSGPGRRLPYVVQHDVNSYVHTALPLCIALASGGAGWFAHRFLNLHSYTLTARPDTFYLGYTDAFAYQEVADPQLLTADAAASLGSAVGYLVEMIDADRPTVLFLDDSVLLGLPRRRVREFLFTGYGEGRLHAVGFDARRRFAEIAVAPQTVERAFQAAFETIAARVGLAPTTALGMSLGAWSGVEEPDDARILAEIRRYAEAARPEGFDPAAGWWWFDRSLDLAADAPVRYGVDAHLGAADQIEHHLAHASWPNHPMFHLLHEHKTLLRRALDRVAGSDPAAAPALAECADVARLADRLRLRVLMSQERRTATSLTPADADLLRQMRSRESDALREAVAVAARRIEA